MIVVTIGECTSHNEPHHVQHCQLQLFFDDIVEGNTSTFFLNYFNKREL
jgi:hypothetical protein